MKSRSRTPPVRRSRALAMHGMKAVSRSRSFQRRKAREQSQSLRPGRPKERAKRSKEVFMKSAQVGGSASRKPVFKVAIRVPAVRQTPVTPVADVPSFEDNDYAARLGEIEAGDLIQV